MMRYRRNRASTLEGATQQPQPTSSAPMPSAGYGAPQQNGSTPWAVYQGGAKPVGGQAPVQGNMNAAPGAQSAQQAAMRKVSHFMMCLCFMD